MSKKIKITEEQALRLKLINEDETGFKKYRTSLRRIIQKIDKIYVNLLGITVDDVLRGRAGIVALRQEIDKLETTMGKAVGIATQYVNTTPESGLDLQVEKYESIFWHKYSSIDIIMKHLEHIEEGESEFELMKPFKNTEPKDITSSQF